MDTIGHGFQLAPRIVDASGLLYRCHVHSRSVHSQSLTPYSTHTNLPPGPSHLRLAGGRDDPARTRYVATLAPSNGSEEARGPSRRLPVAIGKGAIR
ncbi:hypothetical protein B0T26DRAFT_117919 [Lasiosphaeria miniovina]|uniref:Uncharacterized protein n=1 Tax=Lasiosphaeria miniovina TaxID=1954250 RepID=A0AA40E4U0_9PEZI|nr:uncharacterized protein B0T26DRAFT_117919 [Lasiosphaeria miniovina]KAK0727115.1 hypothetical protein B0T26DRAFT_117919 [Lasiosphaeria miniovina]